MSKPARVKEKKEYTNLPTAKEEFASVLPDSNVIVRLEAWMAGHNFPAGWKREIKAILKPLL